MARRGALDFLAGDFPTQTRFAVFHGASRQFAVPFTTDLDAVRKGVEAATFGSTAGAGVTAEAARLPEGQQGRAEPGDSAPLPLATATRPSAVRESSARQLASELDTIFAIEGVARALEGIEGRKMILYFAEGWQFSLGVRPQYAEAISAATRANVTVHTLDARGLAYRKLVVAAPLDRVLEWGSAEHHEGPFGGRTAPLADDTGTGAERLAGPNLEELAEDTAAAPPRTRTTSAPRSRASPRNCGTTTRSSTFPPIRRTMAASGGSA